MLFTSLEFLCLFLPITLVGYYILPKQLKNMWLLCCSLFFYGWGEPVFVRFMVASILFNYVMALFVAWARDEEKSAVLRNLLMAVTIAGNLGFLFVYKYMNFATETIRAWIPSLAEKVPQTAFLLPIGISFFTFQAMSYVIDVHRGERVQKNPLNLGLYISFFPQLIAGPIVRYVTVAEQINHRTVTVDSFCEGVRRFVLGFNKKMLLANVMGEVADAVWGMSEWSVLAAWVGMVCYTLQIFFDFSGYSDMAIGLGRMFGFTCLENFDYPYCSGSVTEFWRRWHISLGSWFRDYVYFPLGGSRVKGKLLLVRNLMIVWLLTGVWHGADWTFILWGVLYGVLITVEKLTDLPAKAAANPPLGIAMRVFTLLTVMLGWVLFRSESVGQAGAYIASLVGGMGNAFADAKALFYLREYRAYIAAAILCSTPVFKKLEERLARIPVFGAIALTVGNLLQLALFVVGVGALVMNVHNPFIYFNF